jgi:hypothetical protein
VPYYQLPNGKTIYISIEEYLDLTDQDIQYYMSINAGQSIQNPWHGSAVKRVEKNYIEEEEDVHDPDPYEDPRDEDIDEILDDEDLKSDDDFHFEVDFE